MDNCIFQIEAALLKFDGTDTSEPDKTSVVKRWSVVDECGIGVVRRIRPATFEIVLLFVFGGDESEFGEFDGGCDGWIIATFELFKQFCKLTHDWRTFLVRRHIL